jgi:SH3-like domain-containing protein
MAFTAGQYRSIARAYEQAAADFLIPEEQREEFARDANWYRLLGDIQAKQESRHEPPPASVASPQLAKDADRMFLSLCALGAGVFLAGSLLLLYPALLDAPIAEKEGASPASLALVETATPMTDLPGEEGLPRNSEAGGSPQYTFSNPSVTASTNHRPEAGAPLAAGPWMVESNISAAPAVEVLQVTTTASIRTGPSRAAKLIGTAAPGTELQVQSRDGKWIQFVDPASGNSGWIHSSLVSSNGGTVVSAHKETAETAAVAKAPLRKAKKLAKLKPKPPAPSLQGQLAQEWKRDRAFAAGRPKGAATEQLSRRQDLQPPSRRGRLGLRERRRTVGGDWRMKPYLLE